MATIRKKGPYQWHCQVRRKGYPSQTRTFETRADAETWARQLEGEIDRGVIVDRREADKNTLYSVLERYAREVCPSHKGGPVEALRCRALMKTSLAKHKMSALSGILLAEYRDSRLKVVATSTVNRELNLLSAAINVARKEWGIHIENPVAIIRRPPSPKARERRLSDEERTWLIEELTPQGRYEDGTLSDRTRNPWIRPVVLFALETAMRLSEILSLHWENVSIKGKKATLPDTKNGSTRDVPLSSRALAVLIGLPQSLDGRVFPVTDNAVKLAFRRAVARARERYLETCQAEHKKPIKDFLLDFHFHDLRHEATTMLAGYLNNVLELAAVTGHKDLRMLKRYYHPKAEDLAEKLG
ncbi:MAG: site-specific integrase [Azospira sp.]|jgi:integrase